MMEYQVVIDDMEDDQGKSSTFDDKHKLHTMCMLTNLNLCNNKEFSCNMQH